MDNGHDGGDSYYEQHNGNYHHHRESRSSVTENHHHQSRSSINHQDVVISRESPYSKDIGDMVVEENGMGHAVNGTSSKYSLLQFAAQHFRNE